MNKLLNSIEDLKRTRIKGIIDNRIREFEQLGKKPSGELFLELCFCLLTANFNAERSIWIQSELGKGFLTLPEKILARMLKRLGHRYPNKRARYIVEARKHEPFLNNLGSFSNEVELRDWLAKNIKGLGYKEASHFIRNIGYKNIAIVDFHIMDLLFRHGLVDRPEALTRKKYLEVEELLRIISEKVNLNLAELDLYLWYIETGRVLK